MPILDPITLTQSLIRCKSVTPDDNGAQGVLKKALEPLGFTIHDLPFEGNGGSYPVSNFFARLGSGGPHLCYNGHTDVVPAGDESVWKHPPFLATIDGDVMYGRGTSDMKGANAAFVVAVAEYIAEHGTPDGSISIAVTGDEEAESINGTVRILEWMAENDHTPDVALVGESSNVHEMGEEIKIGRRGSLHGVLTVNGTQGHVAYPHLADNPIPKMVKLLAALNDYTFDEGSDHFPPTNLEVSSVDTGNMAGNVIPASVSARFNIRFNDMWDEQSLDDKLRAILDKTGMNYELQTRCGAECFITEPGEWTALVSDSVKQITNRTPELSTKGGTSDARFFKHYCPVVEFGLTNETIHKIDEHLKLTDLKALVAIYKDILVRFFS